MNWLKQALDAASDRVAAWPQWKRDLAEAWCRAQREQHPSHTRKRAALAATEGA